MNRNLQVKIFHSFEEENRAEYIRRARMTPQERCREFGVLQERMWGNRWISEPMIKKATWETLAW